MNWNLVGTVALKIGVAVLSGIAIFMSIDKAVNGKKPEPKVDPVFGAPIEGAPEPEKDVVMTGLRATQDTCSKIFNVARDLSSIVESTKRLFGKNSDNGYYPQGYGGYGGYSDGNTRWTRISPFIIEAGPGQYPGPGYSGANNYPF